MKVKLHAYKGCLIIETLDPEVEHPDWTPFGPGRVGCVINNTKENLGVSPEALEFLKAVKPSRDAIGDVMWWETGASRDKCAFGWIGDVFAFKRPGSDGQRKNEEAEEEEEEDE